MDIDLVLVKRQHQSARLFDNSFSNARILCFEICLGTRRSQESPNICTWVRARQYACERAQHLGVECSRNLPYAGGCMVA